VRHDNEPAFILHARAYRETSLLIEAFTRNHGRVGLVARGVRSARSRFPRANLQPLQPLLLGWIAKGELGTLTSAEQTGSRWQFAGDALLAGMTVNELVLRLSSRNDAHPSAFAAYTECLAHLAEGEPIGWTLRRFERDFMADLGYALQLTHTIDGAEILPDAHYAYLVDAGPAPWTPTSLAPRVSGATLLALDRDELPTIEQSAELRRLMRATIRHLVGGDLHAWSLSARRFVEIADGGVRDAGDRADADAMASSQRLSENTQLESNDVTNKSNVGLTGQSTPSTSSESSGPSPSIDSSDL
jgi:DNA repair protein RecO (recombination protein O)